VGIETGLAGEGAEIEAVAAAGIENDVAGRCGYGFRDGLEQGPGDATVVQSPSRRDSILRVARLLRSPFLRLE
jgi:hypothetical protein